MNQMSYKTAKPLLDNGQAEIVKIQPESFSFNWNATIRVDGKHEYQVILSAAQKLALNLLEHATTEEPTREEVKEYMEERKAGGADSKPFIGKWTGNYGKEMKD